MLCTSCFHIMVQMQIRANFSPPLTRWRQGQSLLSIIDGLVSRAVSLIRVSRFVWWDFSAMIRSIRRMQYSYSTSSTVTVVQGHKLVDCHWLCMIVMHIHECCRFVMHEFCACLWASTMPSSVQLCCCGFQSVLVMVALCNREDHYIFALWFLSFSLLSFFPA